MKPATKRYMTKRCQCGLGELTISRELNFDNDTYEDSACCPHCHFSWNDQMNTTLDHANALYTVGREVNLLYKTYFDALSKCEPRRQVEQVRNALMQAQQALAELRRNHHYQSGTH